MAVSIQSGGKGKRGGTFFSKVDFYVGSRAPHSKLREKVEMPPTQVAVSRFK